MATIIIYTDGSSRGNPGPGGYGTILISPAHKVRKELSGGFRLTTNNRMELLAVITGLEALKSGDNEVVIYSDSQYVVNAVEKGWVFNWEKQGFKGKKNPDLWQRFLAAYRRQRKVWFQWVKGHAGHPENERCDQLATMAADQPILPPDEYFEQHPN
ncbi:ribonuclease HI [Rhodoflexus caldus]|uniref:ribonuclease HI n=1 Tax=Rhodoflexus caldus TaxID=2891236 RepID=UPI002029C585|nr:ribonuclease HI [Rhodoflexus caldus]